MTCPTTYRKDQTGRLLVDLSSHLKKMQTIFYTTFKAMHEQARRAQLVVHGLSDPSSNPGKGESIHDQLP